MKHRRKSVKPNRPTAASTISPAPAVTSQPRPLSANPPPAPIRLDPRRRVLFIFISLVLLPLVVLCLLELGLRVAGYGYNTAFFKPLRIGNQDYLVDNDKFGWRFFPPEISRSPTPMRIPAHKPAGTYRIFLLGESAALGDPEPAFGVGRYLQTLLEERYPQTRFEVVPAAMTAINSHAVLPIARECAQHEGDLWIIYMGNNEMIGPFGAITVFGSQSPPLWYVRFSLAIQRTRVGQLLTSLGRRLTGASGQHGPSWGGMQMFLKNQIAPGDKRKDRVYHAFESNLADILRAGRSAGVPMILSTVAVNLKDCAPFGSLPNTNSASYDPDAFDRLNRQGIAAQAGGDLAAALTNFTQAATLDPHFAEMQFRWGKCLLGLTNPVAALPHLVQARDDDALPFRTDSQLNAAIVQSTARFAGRDLVLFDAVSFMATNSPVGIPGDEAFYEHVHLNFDGNYKLAEALAAQVMAFLPPQIARAATPQWASQQVCERDLGLTDWNRRDVYDNMRRRFLQAPFTGQPANAQKARDWQERIGALQHDLTETNAAVAREVYQDSISRRPDDFRLYINYAGFLEAVRDLPAAVEQWKKVHDLLPHHYLASYEVGRLLAQMDQAEEARSWLTRALVLRPDLSEGWYQLGRVQGGRGEFQAALASFARARELVPGEPRYRCDMAKALIKLQRREEAIAQLEEAARLGPISWDAHYLLGEQLAFSGRIAEAQAQFEYALRLNPGYPLAHLNLGIALAKQGKLPQARLQFEEVLRLDPENRLAKQALAQLGAVPEQTPASPGPR